MVCKIPIMMQMERLWGMDCFFHKADDFFWWSSRHLYDFPRMKKFSIATFQSSSALFHHSENVFQNLDYGIVGEIVFSSIVSFLFFFFFNSDRSIETNQYHQFQGSCTANAFWEQQGLWEWISGTEIHTATRLIITKILSCCDLFTLSPLDQHP